MLLVIIINCAIWPKERTVQSQIRSSLGQWCAIWAYQKHWYYGMVWYGIRIIFFYYIFVIFITCCSRSLFSCCRFSICSSISSLPCSDIKDFLIPNATLKRKRWEIYNEPAEIISEIQFLLNIHGWWDVQIPPEATHFHFFIASGVCLSFFLSISSVIMYVSRKLLLMYLPYYGTLQYSHTTFQWWFWDNMLQFTFCRLINALILYFSANILLS